MDKLTTLFGSSDAHGDDLGTAYSQGFLGLGGAPPVVEDASEEQARQDAILLAVIASL